MNNHETCETCINKNNTLVCKWCTDDNDLYEGKPNE